MDTRIGLAAGTVLDFPGLSCHIESQVGRGSNAIVYRGWYADGHQADQRHEVLVKELFPLEPGGGIRRGDDGRIACAEAAGALWEAHLASFESGNAAHLALLRKHPDDAGANLNTYAFNGTLYTVLGFNGGRSLASELRGPAVSLRPLVERMLKLLDALEGFHDSGLLHLDIAPDNIMLLGKGQRERVMLIDYNSCRPQGAPIDSPRGAVSVKPGYTAPEIRSGRVREIGPWSDLYSVAAVFFCALTGAPLTPFQSIRPIPSDVEDCPCLSDMPQTVRGWARHILRRGLWTLTGRRYRSVGQMRDDFRELLDRVDGVGITHWALWEAGWRNVDRAIRDNPSMAFMRDSEALYPSNAEGGGEVRPLAAWVEGMLSPEGESRLLIAGGGMGKTTALLRTALEQPRQYDPRRPAVAYVSLYGWQAGERDYVLNRVLETLRFKAETRSFEDARKVLSELLDQPLAGPKGETPALLLLLDGLNEAAGDTRPLLEEIARLSGLRGLRMLVATRADEPALPFGRLRLAALTDGDVGAALSRAGLLPPESPRMRALLQTPLMLSIFIQSSLAEGRQLRLSGRDELMRAYFDALRAKELSRLPDAGDERWQLEAALELVLPALARELHRKRRALGDDELLGAVEGCYRLFDSRLLRRAFPRWIGRSRAIRGGAASAEEWYGLTVHDILWKRLGLLLRDDRGRYQIAHQTIEEYLLGVDRENRQKIARRGRQRAALALGCALALALGLFFACDRLVAPKPPAPYDETLAENVMDRAAVAYAAAGKQYEDLENLAKRAAEAPADYETARAIYAGGVAVPAMPTDRAEALLARLLETGEAMPWSGKPMDAENALALMSLYEDRREEYGEYAALLDFVMTDDSARARYGESYPKLLLELLDADADITATLYQIVCEPHVTGIYANGSVTELNYDKALAQAVAQNAHLSGVTDLNVLGRNLANLYEKRRQCKNRISVCGVKGYYNRAKEG